MLTPRGYVEVAIPDRFTINSSGVFVPTWTADAPLMLQEPIIPSPLEGMDWWTTAILSLSVLLPPGTNVADCPRVYVDLYGTSQSTSAGGYTLRCDIGATWNGPSQQTGHAGQLHKAYAQQMYHGPAFSRTFALWMDVTSGLSSLHGSSGSIRLLVGHEPVGFAHAGGI